MIEVDIELKKSMNIYGLLRQLQQCYKHIDNNKEIQLNIVYKCGNFINSEIYVVIAAFKDFLEKKNILVTATFDTVQVCDTVSYAARINFFKLLNIEYFENFNRNNENLSVLEITSINDANLDDINNKISDRIYYSFVSKKKIVDIIAYALVEMNGNVITHSNPKSKLAGEGFVYVQNYQNEIKLTIVDTGVGICSSLQKNPKHQQISEEQALKDCIKQGVTDGLGVGNGLFFASEFVKYNTGKLEIYSGNYHLTQNAEKITISEGVFWQGTIIFITFNKNIEVNREDIIGASSLTYDELIECRNESSFINDELW